jgi:putative MFS transporter
MIVVAICCLIWVFDVFETTTLTLATPAILQEFGLTRADIGVLRLVTTWIGVIGVFAITPLADVFGRRIMMSVVVLGYSLLTGLTGFVQSFLQLLAATGLARIPLSGVQVAAVMAVEASPTRGRGLAQGLYSGGYPIGFFLSSLVSIWVIPHLGWRFMYFLGILPALLAFFVLRNIKESPRFARVEAEKRAEGQKTKLEYATALRRYPKEIALGTLTVFCFLFPWVGWSSWVPTYMTTEMGLGLETSSTYLSIWMLLGFFAYLANGWVADRVGRRIIVPLTVIPAGLLLAFYGAFAGQTGIFVVGTLINILMIGNYGAGYYYLTELFPTEVRATAYGICYAVGFAGSGFAPLVAGFTPSIAAAWPFYAAPFLVLAPLYGLVFKENIGKELIDRVGQRVGEAGAAEPSPAAEVQTA